MIDASSGVYIPDGLSTLLHPIGQIIAAPWNPNSQKERTFNALVKNIQEDGFDEPLQVVPLDADHEEMREKYLTAAQQADGLAYVFIVGGHHRFEAGKVLTMSALPCIQKPLYDDDMAMFQNVRRNVLRGEMSPEKFTMLFNEVAERHGEELAREMMALQDEREFGKLFKRVRDDLPDELKAALDKGKDDIKTVDDLSRVLNELFSRHGDTLDQSFMAFTFGGKTHLWVDMSRPMMKQVEALKTFCHTNELDINIVLNELFLGTTDLIAAKGDAFKQTAAE